MGAQPQPPTVAEAARAAVEAVDPERHDAAVAELERRLEDRDEPITAIEDIGGMLAEERGRIDPAGEDPALEVLVAAITYLAFRRDQLDSDPEELIRLAVRAELSPEPPESVRSWLERRRITV